MKLVILLLFSIRVFATELDPASTAALHKTQTLMKNQSQRNQFIKSDAKASQADAKVRELSSSEQTQQKVYESTSDIFGSLVDQTGGDVNKQKAILDKAMTDPEGFYNSLSPAQKAQIRGLAEQIEKENPRGSQLP